MSFKSTDFLVNVSSVWTLLVGQGLLQLLDLVRVQVTQLLANQRICNGVSLLNHLLIGFPNLVKFGGLIVLEHSRLLAVVDGLGQGGLGTL